MELKQIPYNTASYAQMLELRNRILRIPLGMLLSDKEIAQEVNDIFIACYTKGATQLMGCCVLTRINQHTIRLRQMAVDTHWQRKGIGSMLLDFAEQIAKQQVYRYIYLHARKDACVFYKKNGYSIEGDQFIEVGIAHYEMMKHIELIRS